jgi:uncharacterized BrkB/YihY/UPF0761 family membrane protein
MTKHLKRSFVILGLLFFCLPVFIILHNLISGLLGIEEPLFFLLSLLSAFALPLAIFYVFIALILSVISKIPRPKQKRKKKKS